MTHRSALAAECTLIVLIVWPGPIRAEQSTREGSDPPAWNQWLDNPYYQIKLDVRTRIELADFDGLKNSEAYTMRTRLGVGSKPFFGFSGYAELESSFSIEGSDYFDLVESPTGQSPIADPAETDLNQLFVRYHNEDWFDFTVVAGRQRIKLDDDRFIGNVGWRQNEQTYDAVLASTSLGIDRLTATYGYVWDVRRIFGGNGRPATRDFDSDSHLIRLEYDRWSPATIALFAYLLDFDGDSPGNSSNSYGFRVTGSQSLGGDWSVHYAGSYAFQTDAADNPVDYEAHYGAIDSHLEFAPAGSLGIGFEHLGSDHGKARFVTPLATGHKFNGFADTFLNNGGPNGLEDLYLTLVPRIPAKFKGRVVYHHFWSDERGRSLGDEVDVLLSRQLAPRVTALTKFAYFDRRSGSGLADRWRWWFQLTFAL